MLHAGRLVTITGPGGCGKTRMSIELARDLVDKYADGVWLIELASVTDPLNISSKVALTIGVRDDGAHTIDQALVGAFESKQVLILLDNCEHLVLGCAKWAESILSRCPHVAILATSQENLGITGERLLPMSALSLPRESSPITSEAAMQFDSVRLFVERARASDAKFTLSHGNLPQAVSICRKLEGMPLAIELAAARVRSMPLNLLLNRLSNRLAILTGGDKTATPRHQALRATIDWSYDLLTEAERIVFSRLAVFASGWTLDHAEQVVCGDGIEESEVLDLLGRLVDKSLISFDAGLNDAESGVEPRYAMLESLREYSLKRLEDSGELDSVYRRHAEAFAHFAKDAGSGLRGACSHEWMGRLDADLDNLRAAMHWAIIHAPITSVIISTNLHLYWFMRGNAIEGLRWVTTALSRVNESRESEEALSDQLRGDALNAAGTLMWAQGKLDEAERYYAESYEIAKQLNHANGMARGLNNLAMIAGQRGDIDKADSCFHEALEVYKGENDLHHQGACLNNLARNAFTRRDLAQAQTYYEKSIDLFELTGNREMLAYVYANMGSIAFLQRQYARTLEHRLRALRVGLRIPLTIAQIINDVAEIYVRLTDFRSASALLCVIDQMRAEYDLQLAGSELEMIEHLKQVIMQYDVANLRGSTGTQVLTLDEIISLLDSKLTELAAVDWSSRNASSSEFEPQPQLP